MSANDTRRISALADSDFTARQTRRQTSRRSLLKASGATAIAAVAGTLGWPKPDVAAAQGNQRPLSDFVNAQGTTAVFTPPEGDILAWSTPVTQIPITLALVDYAGVWARWLQNYGISLGTTVSGSVTERRLADGTAEVHVSLRATRALTWAVRASDAALLNTPKAATRVFGYDADQIRQNSSLQPALADAHLQVTFINPAGPGAPLPNLVGINLGTFDFFNLKYIVFDANATGPLLAAAGLGPDGTPGRCIVGQTGLPAPALRNGFRGALGDAFPREMVELRRQ